jgi:uncharacterized delta-60 repeat protein
VKRLTSRFFLLSLVGALTLGGAALAAPGDLDSSFSSDGKVATNFTAGEDEPFAIAIQPDGKILAGGGSPLGRQTDAKFAIARYLPGGGLDATFSGDGQVTTNFTSGNDWVNALVAQNDGTIVAVGGSRQSPRSNDVRFALARYNIGGGLDTSFGGDGTIVTNFTPGYDYVEDVAVQIDGKFVVAGGADGAGGRFALARYNADGSLDTTFSGDGKVTTNLNTGFDDATGVAVQADGKIVAAGWTGPRTSNDYRFAVARYNPDGSLDSTFSGDGVASTDFTGGNDYAWDMALQADEKIVAVGSAAGQGERFALARYNANGSLDTTFSGDGKVVQNLNTGSDVLTGVSVDASGRIVAAGWTGPRRSLNYRFAVARYNPDGSLDSTFSGDGVTSTDFTGGNDYAWDMALQEDEKIVAVGRAGGQGGRFALARYAIA